MAFQFDSASRNTGLFIQYLSNITESPPGFEEAPHFEKMEP